jgi:hypothetical protein
MTWLLIFVLSTSYSQVKYDTTVRKKYLDSLKYQLSLYTLSSYTYLNMYDRSENQKDSVIRRLNSTEQYITRYRQYHRRSNIRSGLLILGLMISSFIAIIKFSN